MPDQQLELTTETVGAVTVVRAAGRLDTGTAEAFDARMRDTVNADAARVVLDLAEVSYVSSAGLRSLLLLLKQTKVLGGALVLAAVHPRVKDILDIAGFTTAFSIAQARDEAIAGLQPGQ